MVLIIVLLTLILLLCLLCYVCFRLACVRGRNIDRTREELTEENPLYPYRQMFKEAGEWLDTLETEPLEITSFDGLRLHGEFINKNSKKTIILMHGYRSHWRGDFGIALPFYLELGFNLLMVDQRCHGKSQGRYITYGAHERFDCRDWIKAVIEKVGPDSEVFLSGMSMGASTVLLAAGLELPPQVKGIVADCGFTCGYDIVKNTAQSVVRFMPKIIMDSVNFLCRIFANFDLKESNTLVAMQRCKTPILFIHGTHDTFVPCEMTLRNHGTCAAKKELLTVRGAEHGMSYLIEEERCRETLKNFINKYSN